MALKNESNEKVSNTGNNKMKESNHLDEELATPPAALAADTDTVTGPKQKGLLYFFLSNSNQLIEL